MKIKTNKSYTPIFWSITFGIFLGLLIAIVIAIIVNEKSPITKKIKTNIVVEANQEIYPYSDNRSKNEEKTKNIQLFQENKTKIKENIKERKLEKKISQEIEYWLQFGVFQFNEAQDKKKYLSFSHHLDIVIDERKIENSRLWRVRAGPFISQRDAFQKQLQLKNVNISSVIIKSNKILS